MKIIVRAQLVTDWGEVTEVDVATFSRPAFGLNELITAFATFSRTC
jgi:hypothetical protein